jgi:hypothetical protein
MRYTATPHYSTVRVRTASDSQLQNTSTSHYSAVRIRTTSGSHTPPPHYGSARARTHQTAWCATACSRNPASRTLTVILINLVTHGY